MWKKETKRVKEIGQLVCLVSIKYTKISITLRHTLKIRFYGCSCAFLFIIFHFANEIRTKEMSKMKKKRRIWRLLCVQTFCWMPILLSLNRSSVCRLNDGNATVKQSMFMMYILDRNTFFVKIENNECNFEKAKKPSTFDLGNTNRIEVNFC